MAGVVGMDSVDGQQVLVAADRRGQGVGLGQPQRSGLLVDEPADGLEAGPNLQGGEVRGNDDRYTPQPGGDEGEVVVDGLLDQLTLGGQEGGVVQTQADRDDVGLAAQDRLQPGAVPARRRTLTTGQMAPASSEEPEPVRRQVHLPPPLVLAHEGGPAITGMAQCSPAGGDGVTEEDSSGEVVGVRNRGHDSRL